MADVANSVETLPKITMAWVGCTNVTDRQRDRRQTTDRRTDDDIYASSRSLKIEGAQTFWRPPRPPANYVQSLGLYQVYWTLRLRKFLKNFICILYPLCSVRPMLWPTCTFWICSIIKWRTPVDTGLDLGRGNNSDLSKHITLQLLSIKGGPKNRIILKVYNPCRRRIGREEGVQHIPYSALFRSNKTDT